MEESIIRATKKILFIQEFSLSMKGGGATILKRLQGYSQQHGYEAINLFETSYSSLNANIGSTEHQFTTLTRSKRFGIGRLNALLTLLGLDNRASISLASAIDKVKPDIIHVTAHGVSFPAIMKAASKCNVKVVISVHDLWPLTVKAYIPVSLSNLIFKQLIKRIHTIFVISQNMADYSVTNYGERNYKVIHDGIDNIKQSVSHINMEVEPVSFFYVGLIHDMQREIVAKFLHALSSIPMEFRIGICSNSEVVNEMQYQNIEVQNYGWQDEQKLISLSANYTYGLLPLSFDKSDALFYQTSLMTKIPFYLRVALPIICIGPAEASSVELIEREEIGFTIKRNDLSLMKAQVQKLIDNHPNMYPRYQQNINKSISKTFNLETIVERFYSSL